MSQRKNQALSADVALKLSQIALRLTTDLGVNLTVSKQMTLDELVLLLERDQSVYKKILLAIKRRRSVKK
jgi:hypothetical protein